MNNIPSDTDNDPERRARRSFWGGAWWGLALIIMGIAFLLRNFGWLTITGNWWAIFLFIPAIGAFVNAWDAYNRTHTFNGRVRGSLIGGLMLTFIGSAFLLDLNWQIIWPIFLILGGISALLGGWIRR